MTCPSLPLHSNSNRDLGGLLTYLFISLRLLAPTRAARGAWLRGNVCNRQHTLGITSTPFRAFRPNSCCCISLHLHLLGCVGRNFFKVWWPLSLGESDGSWGWGKKSKALGEFIILLPLPWPYPNRYQEEKKTTSSCSETFKDLCVSCAGRTLGC